MAGRLCSEQGFIQSWKAGKWLLVPVRVGEEAKRSQILLACRKWNEYKDLIIIVVPCWNVFCMSLIFACVCSRACHSAWTADIQHHRRNPSDTALQSKWSSQAIHCLVQGNPSPLSCSCWKTGWTLNLIAIKTIFEEHGPKLHLWGPWKSLFVQSCFCFLEQRFWPWSCPSSMSHSLAGLRLSLYLYGFYTLEIVPVPVVSW